MVSIDVPIAELLFGYLQPVSVNHISLVLNNIKLFTEKVLFN